MAKNQQKRNKKKGGNKPSKDENESIELSSDSRKEIPWFLSQQAMGFGAVIAIASLYLKDNASSFLVKSAENPYSSFNNADPMSQCGLVMANSTLSNSGWGMFPLVPLEPGQPVSFGDPVVQVPDIPKVAADSLSHILHNYMWTGDVTGGIHEGRVVYTLLPGVGSLANGHPQQHNMVPQNGAQIDTAGVSRKISPGAGAFTAYHNFHFHASTSIAAGQELLVNYGAGWSDKISHDDLSGKTTRSVESLRQNGICLDHIQPGVSKILHAGRGAFATRDLPVGTVVAPVPLIPIARQDAMNTLHGAGKQMLLNYCFGHEESSLLFVPYAPVVNLVNHARTPNVKMQWSKSSLHLGKELVEGPLINLNGLLLELVAIDSIEQGEEIVVDYGEAWQAAWNAHVRNFVPPKDVDYEYASQYKVNKLRTSIELVKDPYPSNLRPTCYYQPATPQPPASTEPVQWNPNTPKTYANLYPCHIVERNDDDNTYTAVMANQEWALKQTQLPPNYVVQSIPRHAIVMSDKHGSSDQHLADAFRHYIAIPDEIFPRAWRNHEAVKE